jgi:hypothetical protein
MQQRIKIATVSPGAFQTMLRLETYLRECGLAETPADVYRR